VVFGRTINQIISGSYGTNIEAGVSFNPLTVRTINLNNGVYSINGMLGSVQMQFDNNITASSVSNQCVLSAISVPSNLTYITMPAPDVILGASTKELLDVNVVTGDYTSLTPVDKIYNCITNTGTGLIGSVYSMAATSLYTLTSIPATLLTSGLTYSVVGMTADSSGNLWVLTPTSLINLGNPGNALTFAVTPVNYTNTTNLIFNSLTYCNGNFIATVSGDADYTPSGSGTFSSTFYLLTPGAGIITASVMGVMTDISGNNHLDNVIALTANNGALYALTYSATNGNKLYSVNLDTMAASAISTFPPNPTQTITTAFAGGINIDVTPVIPLKTINGVAVDSNNNINLSPSTTPPVAIAVTPTSSDTITITLPIADQNLNVIRTTTYE
jgi:hypothetical protein